MSFDDDTINSGHPSSLGLVAAACVLALGLGAGGYFFGTALDRGFERLHKPHTVSVKGLAERAVKADLALWPLRFVATGSDLAAVQMKIDADMKAVTAFLKEQGLSPEEVIVGRTDVVDKLANEYGEEKNNDNRFILYANVMIRSANVDAVQTISRRISELVKSGVVFTAAGAGRASLSPYFLFTKLNDVKLDMLAEATRNARAAAEQFAHDASVPLGTLVEANQGVFSILPGDPIPDASEDTQVNKTVRVVSTVQYAVGG